MPPSKLALYRRKKGMTQEHLAELSGVTTRTIQRIEKGSVVPHIQTLKILADCLEIDPELLMDEPEGTANTASITPLFHLLALIGLSLPVLNILLPFLLWLLKREENQEYNHQGKQVLNFQLSMSMLLFPAIALMVFYFPLGFPLTVLIYVFMVIMTLLNLYRSIKLQPVKYPFSYVFF
ncbi:helix-turn-helix domain-containing protein [Pedobacter gandavensis]|uniref:helix-turn-helix domain-containing protein n=1 Tax=Pedobacter TaxID=84567 RepID=UPI001C9A115B|nr:MULTISPECIES: helix-turn-helix domain-containing protein [Pedobacter]WGQ10063.1 helix-turn-helix domain-containing protein [Pedobacter gandavensis]